MRAEGKSYHAISEQIGVSKTTLIDWAKKLQTEVKNLKTIRLESLYEQYHMTKEARIKLLGEQLERVSKEIADRSLTDISADKLFDIFLKLGEAQNKEKEKLIFSEPDMLCYSHASNWPA